jgi:AraC-like DNA-binding protein
MGQLPVAPELDFPGSLELALRAYVAEGRPSIQFAAEIAGTSVRTLQRRLARHGLSYSDLAQQARFATAARLLEDPDTKVIDVAYSVGYEDPSHFTRAFRRLSGVSPREYRHYLAIHPLESCVPLQ